MNAKMIVILMMIVLVVLFVWVRFYRKKEINRSQIERECYAALKLWLETKDENHKKAAIELQAKLLEAHGESAEHALAKATVKIEQLSV